MKAIQIAALIMSSILCGCTRKRPIVLQMEWSNEALPYPFRPLPPEAVRLTFVGAPNGRRTVAVEFDVSCGIWERRSIAYNITSIDKVAVPGNADGWAESTGDSFIDPTSAACQ
jgi:hypothetical protein